MFRTGTVDGERLPVLRGPVPLVVLEAVDGKPDAQVVQHPVALDLRDDRRRRYGGTERVAVNDRELGKPDPRERDRVEKKSFGLGIEREDRQPHRGEARSKDVPEVDLRGAHDPDAYGHRVAADGDRQSLAGGSIQALRVVEPDQDAACRQDHRGRDDWTGEGAASDLVDSRDEAITAAEELRLNPGELTQAAELRE
jgi:hypothetical protein